MVSVAQGRRPGVRFEVTPASPEGRLPPMDVAAFVGFAASGPLDTPVPVEDVARFREIFGPDLPLARDPEDGSLVHAALGQAVELFFENGGRRCWVVRVADRRPDHRPVAPRFPVPGLFDGAGLIELAPRSEGTWSEGLVVAAREDRLHLGRPELRAAAGGLVLRLPPEAASAVEAGDLLRLELPGALLAFLEAEQVAGREVRLAGFEAWFEAQAPAGVTVLVARGSAHPAARVGASASGGLLLAFAAPMPPAGEGELVELRSGVGSAFALVERAGPLSASDRGSLGAAPTELLASRVELSWPLTPRPDLSLRGLLGAAALGAARLARARFGLQVQRGERVVAALGDLGFRPAHRRFFGWLPDDAALFAHHGRSWAPRPHGAWAEEVLHPRFPLAAAPGAPGALPLGMPWAGGRDVRRSSGAGPEEGRIQREGLSRFSAGLFADPELAFERAFTLAASAEARLRARRPLLGIHALWPVAEVSLIAVPDAGHGPWSPAPPEPPASLEAPELTLAARDDTRAFVEWTAVAPRGASSPPAALRYRLEVAGDPDFRPAALAALDHDLDAELDLGAGCGAAVYARVRAEEAGVVGPWSATLVLPRRPGGFAACAAPLLEAPPISLALASPPEAPALVVETTPGHRYRIEAAAEPTFGSARLLLEADALDSPDPADWILTVPLPFGAPGPTWFRARALGGPWSAAVRFDPAERARPIHLDEPSAGRATLVEVQRLLLRMAAARGDLTAILALGRREAAEAAPAHLARLWDPSVPGEALGAPPLLATEAVEAHGALYLPHLERRVGGDLRGVPPEGAVSGMIAHRSATRGAWIAPANVVLGGTTGPRPEVGRAHVEALLGHGINVLERGPRGLLPLAARTLSADPVLRDLGAARLAILVRRLLTREGEVHTFEPHDRRLAARITDDLERLFAGLWRAGALAGRTAAEGFHVRAGGLAGSDPERGRFVAEVRYAPSSPLELLVVRLVESGRGLAVEAGR